MEDAGAPGRKFPRIPSENPLLVRRAGEEESGVFSRTRTLGGGGAMFESRAPFGAGTALWITISVKGGFIEAPVRVAWEREAGGGLWEVGVEFLDLSPLDRAALEEVLSRE